MVPLTLLEKKTESNSDGVKFHGLSLTSIIQGQVGFKKLAGGFFLIEDKAPRPFQLFFFFRLPVSPCGLVSVALARLQRFKFHNGGRSFYPNPEI